MKIQDREWLDQHKNFLYVSSYMTKEERQMLYDIYNRLTRDSKKPTSCGKCVQTTIKTIKHYYEKTDS